MQNSQLLQVSGLKTYFFISRGVIKAVDGVDLKISPNEAVGLVGESGCGKTVTALSIMRLVPIPPGRFIDGEIIYRDKNILKLTEDEMINVRGNEISMVFQDPMTFLNPVMKVGDQITEVINQHQELKKEEAKDKAKEALKLVRIPDPEKVYDYYPHQLSGGMRQRALIAMALSCNPSLLIADEPTTALDVTIQRQILNLIQKIRNEFGTSLLLITHDLGIVAEVVDRVYVMYIGKIMEHANVFSLYEKPKHPYTKGLLKAVLSIDEFKEKLVTIGGMIPDPLNPPLGCKFHPRCPEAIYICKRQEPPMMEIEDNHFVSCWLYH